MNTTKGTKTKADLAREFATLRDSFLHVVEKLQQRDKMIENVLFKILEDNKAQDVQELEYKEEELFEKFEPLIGLYGVEKSSGKIIKVITATAAWKLDGITNAENTETLPTFKFVHVDGETKEINARGVLEAWAALRKYVLADKTVAVEEPATNS